VSPELPLRNEQALDGPVYLVFLSIQNNDFSVLIDATRMSDESQMLEQRYRFKSNPGPNVALQHLRLRAEDAHLETKRSYQGEASRSESSDDSAPPLHSGLRRAQHRGNLIVRSLNEGKKSERLEGPGVPRRTCSRKNSWIGSSVRMRVSESKRTQFESFNAYP
jgi:hypothetical protein